MFPPVFASAQSRCIRSTPTEIQSKARTTSSIWRAPVQARTPPMAKMTNDGQTGLRPESCWNDCLTRRKSIRPCVPSHVAYEVGAARQQTVRSPRTMYPHSQEWHRNREATMHLPASGGEDAGMIVGARYRKDRKRR